MANKTTRTRKVTKKATARASRPTTDASSASRRIDRAIAELGDWRGRLLADLRKLIREVDPDVVEEWKWMGTPVWSHDGMFVLANAHKAKVKITFCHGAELADPSGVFNAGLDGGKWRAIDLAEGDTIDAKALAPLLRRAIARNTRRATRAKRQGVAVTEEPVLLSGGNPQIGKGDGDAPVQQYIAAMPGWKRGVGRILDALIVRTVPAVQKAVKWNSPFYGMAGQGWFLSFHTFTTYVKVAFFRGSSLQPLPPGVSKQKDVRYLDIREHDPIDEERFAAWIRQAASLPGWIP